MIEELKTRVKSTLKKNRIVFFYTKKTYIFIRPLYVYILSYVVQCFHYVELLKAKRKYSRGEKIKVGFLIINESIWKYEGLYRLLASSKYFEPIVYVCPYTVQSEKKYITYMDELYERMTDKGYFCVNTRLNDGTYLDLKKEKLSFLFLSSPWGLTLNKYLVGSLKFNLICYVHYGFQTSSLFRESYNMDLMNLCWRYFVSSEQDIENSKKYSMTGARNLVVTGYPGLDQIIFPINKKPLSALNDKKVIIWAPHHTIDGVENILHYATFLKYFDYFLELSEKYKDEIVFVFKPHPVLLTKLYKVWGEKRTNKYYSKWNNIENRLIVEGDYINLFHTSTALIHDSGSFVAEYLATKKPAMFLINDESVKEEFNSIGREAIEAHYQGYNRDDIDDFIKNVILDDNDFMQKKRNEFFDKYLLPPNKKTASKNIFDYIVEKLE